MHLKRLLPLIISTIALVSVAGCGPRYVKKHIAVERLQDGRRAYHGDDGTWYYYTVLNNQWMWQPGPAPSASALASAVIDSVDINVAEGSSSSAPLSDAQVSESGGGVSMSSEGPSASSPSVDGGSSGGDSSSSGGDGGGGGGE